MIFNRVWIIFFFRARTHVANDQRFFKSLLGFDPKYFFREFSSRLFWTKTLSSSSSEGKKMSAFRVLLRALARREQRQQQQQLLFSSSFTSSSTLLSRTLLLGGGGGGGGTPGVAVTKKKAALSTFSRVSSSSLSSSSSFSNNNYDEEKEEHRKRLINKTLYRAKQRGFLELDVVVGEWAERNLNAKTTSDSFLTQFAKVLEEENPDLYSYLTGQSEAPKYLREENEAYKALKAHVMKFLDEKSDEKTRAKFGKEWVRGWNDGSSEGGNQ